MTLIMMVVLGISSPLWAQSGDDWTYIKARMEESWMPVRSDGGPKSFTIEDMQKYRIYYIPDCIRWVNDIYPKDYNGPRSIKNSSGKWVDFGYNPMCGLDVPPSPYKTVDEYLTACADRAICLVSKEETDQSKPSKAKTALGAGTQENTDRNPVSPINLTELVLMIQQFIRK